MFGISTSPYARAYLGPFVIFMLLLALGEGVAHFGDGLANWVVADPKYWIFPLQTIVCGAGLIIWWKFYDFQWSRGWMAGLGTGVLVFGLWISPQWLFGAPLRTEGFDPGFFGPGGPYWANLTVR